MNRLILFIITSLLWTIQSKAEGIYTYGESIDFQPGFVGSLWHPFMKASKYSSIDDDQFELTLLTVVLKTSDRHEIFPEDTSTLLLKFSDNSIAELESFGDVLTDYNCHTINAKLIDVYFTGRRYVIPADVRSKLLSLPITKVRVELSNGDRRDFEVNEKHGKKVLKKLQKSFEKIDALHQKRIKNATSDIKDDF